MPRYRELQKSELDAEQQRVWNDCTAGPRGSVPPPVHMWLRSPGLADHAHRLGAHVRFGTGYSQRLTEIAILVTARYWTAQFEWSAHVRLAERAGVPSEIIDAISERRRPHFTDKDDELVYDFCDTFYRNHAVDDATYARLRERFGEKGVVDLAGLIGYYSFVSITLNTFEVPVPAGGRTLPK